VSHYALCVCAHLQVHKFRWSRALYRNPPRMGPADFQVSPEERERVQAICYDKARKRLQAEIGIRIERLPHLLEIGEFVILKAPNNVQEPFYVAEVSSLIGYLLVAHLKTSTSLNFLTLFHC
jgi:hypothetical protein